MPKAKSIDDLIGVSKEKLARIIKLLIPKHQEFINEKFDEDYNRKPDVMWTEEDTRYFYNNIRKSLKKLAKRDPNMGRHLRKKFTDLIGITVEEFWNNFHRYSKDVQNFTKKHFDENLNMLSNYDEWKEQDKKFYNGCFTSHIRLIIFDGSTRFYQSLPTKFGVTKEEFSGIFNKLSPKSKELINKYYDLDFRPILAIEWTFSDRRYLYNFVYHQIRDCIKTGISKCYQKTYGDLLAKHNITKNQMKFIASKFKPKYQEFLNTTFDADFKIKKEPLLNDEQLKFLQHSLERKIKSSIKKYGIDINNELIATKDARKRTEEALDASFDPIKNLTLAKIEPENLELEKIYKLKSYYQTCYNYLDSLKEQQIKLTLKKD